jgi:hemolysin activation/secretion protein
VPLRLDSLIDSLSADLSTGSRPELGILDVRIKESEPFSAQINLDNERSPSVGEFRRSIQLNHANLLGLGDGLSVRTYLRKYKYSLLLSQKVK